ncbi:MAG: rhomboid family protein [uncultured archaeon A07HB70]|nr:MAG: rhomboid family protein [uncultured archaeon A07HB70]
MSRSSRSADTRTPRSLKETLGLMTVGSLVSVLLGPAVLALATPVARPWTLVTSVYAHAGLWHLLANALVVGVAGLPVAAATTRVRFHGFFLATGAAAGVAQIAAGADAVVGASGAAFALVGYVLAANPVTGLLGARVDVSPRALVVVVAAVAVGLALLLGGSGGALVAHAAGAALGLAAGRSRVLATGGPGTER